MESLVLSAADTVKAAADLQGQRNSAETIGG